MPGPDFEARFQTAADEAYTAYEAGYDSLVEYRRASLLEDLDWLIRTGEVSENAARRLGYDKDGLYSYLNRIRRMDLWQQLTANDPKVAA
ncbi:hypothetical protein [Zhihengliuella halotolerans]|uniref:hypothetical protein n=1 Tax=Zhihengliuella halotolerans TaxID=370736 RepID=UPI0011AF2730|nr:hypothetical protein [Zhihengliuella halotolerans]